MMWHWGGGENKRSPVTNSRNVRRKKRSDVFKAETKVEKERSGKQIE